MSEAEEWTWGLGPLSEAGVGLDCLDCGFQTADERKADVHNAITGHQIAIDYIDHESEWPTFDAADMKWTPVDPTAWERNDQ